MSPGRREPSLLSEDPALPQGFRYTEDVLSAGEEAILLERIGDLPLKEFEFHGFTARRRTISFGWHYDFARSRLEEAEDIPRWLLPLRGAAAGFAGLAPVALPLPAAAKGRLPLGAGVAHGRATVRVPVAGAVANRMGAQHPGRRDPALLDHVPDPRFTWNTSSVGEDAGE